MIDLRRECLNCLEMEPVFQRGRSLWRDQAIGARIIREIKYHHGLYLQNDVERILSRFPDLPGFLGDSVIVPVPLHPSKQRKRGFNQAEWIAQRLSRVFGNDVWVGIERIRNTPSQTRLDRRDRRVNIKGAFQLNKAIPAPEIGRCLVVDDVLTTGATLNACCQVLVEAGWEDIGILTLAHG